ncbi:MAG TPA: YicC family protein [Lachnospiraceae bacterium]|nr:YicC family protein [Lachnospiraceae bacterium]HIS61142.1 YicC family protein [Candidatus Scybalomonas excrementigallinarum]
MIKSMTGFGRSEMATETQKVIVEIKSVNHRYCDLNIKMPKKLSFFESNIRNLLKEYIQRGKVDIYISYEDYTEAKECVRYRKEIAKEYFSYLNQIEKDFGIENDVTVSKLSRYPDVLVLEEQPVDEGELWKTLEDPIREAAVRFVQSRAKEGENLQVDLIEKLDSMLQLVDVIEERSPKLVEEYRQKLEAKVKELLENTSIDESRIATEVTIYADKICVDEEIVRLKSHIASTKDTILAGGSIGRKLDFIAQEMNREANTILSKANDITISNHAIELKTEIEKVREQIQNIE